MSSSLSMLLAMLFAHVGKLSNSRSQMFLKTVVLKIFAIFTGEEITCVECLFNKIAGLKVCIFI